jgi:outer membrane immunogenic protein
MQLRIRNSDAILLFKTCAMYGVLPVLNYLNRMPKMKVRFPYVLLAAAAICSSYANAQHNPFAGASVALNLGLQSNSTEITSGADRITGIGWDTQGANIQGSYGWSMSPSIILTVGANYNLSDVSAGDASTTAGGLSLKRKNAYSLYVEPGYKVADRTMAYAKIGYENASMRVDSSGSGNDKTIDGVGYGLGIRTMLDSSLFLQAEVKQIYYTSATFSGQSNDFKVHATEGLFGLGYQF